MSSHFLSLPPLSRPILNQTCSQLANPIWHCTIMGAETTQTNASSLTSSIRPLLCCLMQPVTAFTALTLHCIASIITQHHIGYTTFPDHMSKVCTGKWHNKTTWRHTAGSHLVKHTQAQIRTDVSVKFYNFIYRGLILSDNYHLSLPTIIPPHVWAVSWMGYVNIINKPTESGNQQLSHKIMTLYDT